MEKRSMLQLSLCSQRALWNQCHNVTRKRHTQEYVFIVKMPFTSVMTLSLVRIKGAGSARPMSDSQTLSLLQGRFYDLITAGCKIENGMSGRCTKNFNIKQWTPGQYISMITDGIWEIHVYFVTLLKWSERLNNGSTNFKSVH